MAKKTTFSSATIDALTKGRLADPQTPGLSIEVLPSGKARSAGATEDRSRARKRSSQPYLAGYFLPNP